MRSRLVRWLDAASIGWRGGAGLYHHGMDVSSRDFFSQFRSWRLWVLITAIVVLTFVHQISGVQTSRFHQVLDIVPYMLIMLGALWFGLVGAVGCAVLTAACYTVHLFVQEHGTLLDPQHFHRTLNICMYLVVGLFTGFLAQKQLDALRRHRALAEQLDKSYQELRTRTEDLLRAEEDVERANRLAVVGELTAGLAHEIGNPLGGIKGAAEILADRVDPESDEGRFARLLLKEVARLDAVVSRFLDSVRPGSDGEGRAIVDEVLHSALALSGPRIAKHGLDVDLEIEDGLPAVAADPQQLYQVFLNLLLNAIQATPPGGSLAIGARRADGQVECRISDTGEGIPAELLPRIFDPFFTRRVGGTGLGLSITQKILEACNGRVEVHSRPGEGTTFVVTLPARIEHGRDEDSDCR